MEALLIFLAPAFAKCALIYQSYINSLTLIFKSFTNMLIYVHDFTLFYF